MRPTLTSLAKIVAELKQRFDAVNTEGLEAVQARAEASSKQLSYLIIVNTTLEQVALLLARQKATDSAQIIAALCRKSVEDKKWFRSTERMSIQQVIDYLREQVNASS
jgi:aspartate aminotransferase-like enzyme